MSFVNRVDEEEHIAREPWYQTAFCNISHRHLSKDLIFLSTPPNQLVYDAHIYLREQHSISEFLCYTPGLSLAILKNDSKNLHGELEYNNSVGRDLQRSSQTTKLLQD